MQERLNVVRLSEDEKSVVILDQTKLPNHEEYLDLEDAESMWNAIKLLQVRGAPAIGVFAGYALAVLAGQIADLPRKEFLEMLQKQADYLNSSRPTAVNLSWALKRQMEKAEKCKENDCHEIARTLIQEAKRIDAENLEMNRKIAEYGVTLIKDGDGILTHCNAGYLACLGYGTATAPMYMAQEKGMHIHVYSDETRPLLQGARLTSFELAKSGVPVTSICDNMASLVMKEGKIQAVMVGCDRIAANGDFANKIGTSGVAILAKYYHIPFYTLGPSSTIDFSTKTGSDIHIEQRDPDEIRSMWYKEPMILREVDCYNPSFDVTDHSLLTAIVTERGIVYPPFEENLKKLFQK
ncbi:MAG: S-methyl-5-thioribose-1-phosphate isomerase [Erysipelotrichaceae bacterium]|jgi:methylthioribose-1-phosphate isomerase|nr:S-methyl-5-thioribose-1-phosphate isomerase [Lactimicrobium massiliense]MCH4019347.1 S-methyl-5-thioribose-1-phosphate isomerase [Erysipelotrichaceae bacterium]MCI1326137.1 S-methyl-5-thioribose-1-phosphate isomerase [Solobacterium sp.]MCH4045658.1 S-methyl-5-thioribose-1-phosphate isomerase [Erysipelotrichaceae bacterium]MCH4122867.1 S-methyl-5-thioribose-1-phosphate isomerase [Erysipelotrichaceae bacterium]MCI1363648.1 S-methyl-5-thioribose-1-phosphate isomerase [Solobacterium sp.]